MNPSEFSYSNKVKYMKIPLVFEYTIDEQKYVKHPKLQPWISRNIEDLMNMYFYWKQETLNDTILRQITLPEEIFIYVVLVLTFHGLAHGILRHSSNDAYRNMNSDNYDLNWFFSFTNRVEYNNEEAKIVQQIQWTTDKKEVRRLLNEFYKVS